MVNNKLKLSFITLSTEKTDINRTATKTKVLSEGDSFKIPTDDTSQNTHNRPFKTCVVASTTSSMKPGISTEISSTTSLLLKATSSILCNTCLGELLQNINLSISSRPKRLVKTCNYLFHFHIFG